METILFVDDDPMVLQGLRRMLHNMRQEWEMAFAGSGAQALALMDQEPFDVLVSDMLRPGMNGAELMNTVMHRYPRTVRLILSGHADDQLIMRCLATTHQFLAKPCDPEALKRTIRRATLLGNSLQNEPIRRLVSHMDRLPTVPALDPEMVEKLQSPNASVEAIAAVVAKDVGMTAKLLKLVNSTFFGLSRQVASPLEAVSYLGVETIKSPVLSIHAFSQFNSLAGVHIANVLADELDSARDPALSP